MSYNEEDITAGLEILCSLFFSKAKKDLWDIPAYIFWRHCKAKELYQPESSDCVYGEFLWITEIEDLLYDERFVDCDENDFEENLNAFRVAVAQKISQDIDGEGDAISQRDVQEMVRVMVDNKFWNDKAVKVQTKVLFQYHIGGSEQVESFELLEESMNMGGIDYSELTQEELEVLEKEAWKRCMNVDYHDRVDNINLTLLKQILTDPMGRPFDPQGWQREFLANMSRFNFIAASRRAGKTWAASYLAARQIYIPHQVIVVVVPTLKNHGKALWRYLDMMIGADPDISLNTGDWKIRHKTLKSEIQFFSAEREDSVRGQAANLLIFDEAAFISHDVYATASPLVRTTNGIIYAISTVNRKTPKNWFYHQLVTAEMQRYNIDQEAYGRRITLDENPFIDDEEKIKIREEGKYNMKTFGAEWMAEFQEVDSFEMTNFWQIDYNPQKYMVGGKWQVNLRAEALDKATNYYGNFIISYDCAKLKDRPGVSVFGSRKGGCDLIMSGYMTGFEYYDQVELLMQLRKLLGETKTKIIIDYRNTGVVVEEIFRLKHNMYVYAVCAVGGSDIKKNGRIYNVGKDLLRAKLKSAISRSVLKGFSFQSELRVELETYDEDDDDRKHGHHYDILNSMFIGAWWADRQGLLTPEFDSNRQQQINHIATGISMDADMARYWQQQDSGSLLDNFGY